jgi:hypothetical protein
VSRREERIADTVVRFLEDPWAVLRQVADSLIVGLRWVAAAAAVILAVAGALAAWRAWSDRRLRSSARRIRILPPPGVAGAPGAEMLWMSLHSLLRPWWRRLLSGQPYLAWEIVARPEEVEVGIWVPREVPPGLVERAVNASWPGARAVETPKDPIAWATRDRNRDGGPGCVQVTELALSDDSRYPVGTPGDGALGLILAGLTGLADGEAGAIQVVARPATSASRRRLVRAAWRLKVGSRRARKGVGGVQGHFLNPALELDVRAVLGKASSPLWHSLVRVAVASPNRERARGRIHGLAGAFAVFEGRNGFRRRRVLRGRARLEGRRLTRPYLLSVPELAQVATLPVEGAIPGLERAGARTVAPPRALPSGGMVLGAADHPGVVRDVAISTEDARHHVHVLGETGTGKSTLLANLALQDALAGRSTVVIDPKGDLVEAILERLPPEAEERTCVLDPEDRDWSVGLNVLAGDDSDLVVEHVLGVFRRIFEPWWGPRTDDVMRAACLTLTQVPGATLAEVPLLLTNLEWRRHIRSRLSRLVGVGAFWDWYERMPEAHRVQHIAPLLNKLRAFLLRGPVRAIVGQADPRLDVASLVDSGGLLLVRIPKGTLGEETSRLLGAFVIARVWQAAMRRAGRPERERPDTTLYVDETHNYLVLPRSFEDLLAEARGYRLSLVLAHQHMGQLPRDVRDALGANARTKVVFTCSPEDAFQLERHFRPQLTEHDLSHLAAFQAACRPCIAGGHGPAFTFRAKALGPGDALRAQAVREASNRMFGARRRLVEAIIGTRHRRIESHHTLGPSPSKQPAERKGGRR